jgi:DNA-binding transcriptional regulator YiaG
MKGMIKSTTTVDVAIPSVEDVKNIESMVSITVPCWEDPDSGEQFLGDDALKLIERTKARHMGLMQPEDIAELRDRLGLKQKEICQLLQIGAKSWSRWETGKERPSRSLNLLLRALWDGEIDVGYLKSLHGKKFADNRFLIQIQPGQKFRPFVPTGAPQVHSTSDQLKEYQRAS